MVTCLCMHVRTYVHPLTAPAPIELNSALFLLASGAMHEQK